VCFWRYRYACARCTMKDCWLRSSATMRLFRSCQEPPDQEPPDQGQNQYAQITAYKTCVALCGRLSSDRLEPGQHCHAKLPSQIHKPHRPTFSKIKQEKSRIEAECSEAQCIDTQIGAVWLWCIQGLVDCGAWSMPVVCFVVIGLAFGLCTQTA